MEIPDIPADGGIESLPEQRPEEGDNIETNPIIERTPEDTRLTTPITPQDPDEGKCITYIPPEDPTGGKFTTPITEKKAGDNIENNDSGKEKFIQEFYPKNNGFFDDPKRIFLYPGDKIDRYGGSDYSKFFSPQSTSKSARALPPSSANQPLRTFEVVKPLEVQSGRVSPAFGEIGLGIQYQTPVNFEILIKRKILKEVKE